MFIYNILTKWSVRGLTLPGVFSLVFVYPYLVARTTCKANTCLSRISLQRDFKDLQCDFWTSFVVIKTVGFKLSIDFTIDAVINVKIIYKILIPLFVFICFAILCWNLRKPLRIFKRNRIVHTRIYIFLKVWNQSIYFQWNYKLYNFCLPN